MAIERSRNSSSPALIFDNINGAEVETDDTLPSRYTGSNSGNDSCRIVQESRKSEDISLIEPVVSQALIPVTVSEAQFQMSTENREGPMRVIHFQESVHVDISNSPKTISDSSHIEKRACRICQSETGEMVRPCACTGTMGDIHERCLNEWLMRSNNNDRCEICQEKYCKSGNILQPIWKWQKPQIEMTNIVEVSSVICLSLCLWYMITLTVEREFFERVFTAGLPPRSPDIARICKHILVTLLIISTLFGGLMNTVMRIWHYINKQRAIRFMDSDVNKKASK